MDTWEYNSPRLRASEKSSDLGLLATALVYYDTIVLEVQNAQQLQDLVAWASASGHVGQLLRLIHDEVLRFHHHAFITAAVNIGGIYSLWHIQESDHSLGNFMRRTVQVANLATLHARHSKALLQAVEQHTDVSFADDYSPPLEDARRAMHDEATSNDLLQAVVDDIYPFRGVRDIPEVDCHIEYPKADEWIIRWQPELAEISRVAGGGLDYRPDSPLTGEALSNRVMWTAADRGYDLVLGDVMTVLVGRKLVEVGRRDAKVPEILYELQTEVDLPDIRLLVNEGRLGFAEVIEIRHKAARFRQWLQERGEKDSSALIAYANETAKASGLARVAGSTIQILGYGATIVPSAVFAYLTNGAMPDVALAVNIGAPTSGLFLAGLGEKLKGSWRPIVFGSYLKRRLDKRTRDDK